MPNAGKPLDSDVPGPPKNDTGATDSTSNDKPLVPESEISGSMKTEEPLGWDQAPQAIDNPRQKRHPRPDGVGGIKPDEGPDRAGDKI